MERRDNTYYEANASDISLEDITSSQHNARILRRLRDDKLSQLYLVEHDGWRHGFQLGEGNDLGWLGYFIGRSERLRKLTIQYLPEDEGRGQQIHAFMDGLARNKTIQKVTIGDEDFDLSNNGFAAIARALGNLSQLEELSLQTDDDAGLNINRCSALGNLLESGVWKLKKIRLDSNNIGDAGVAALAHGLRSIGPSLKALGLGNNSIDNEGLSSLTAALVNCTSLERLDLSKNDFSNEGLSALAAALANCTSLKWLDLSDNDFSNEGLSVLVDALANCTSLKWLDLSDNDFSLAAAGLVSLSDWLQIAALNLNKLRLRDCDINDEGLQAMAGTVNHCKDLDLSSNQSITASGLRYLSASLQSENCCLKNLYLGWMDTVNGGVEVLARGLVGNKVLRRLHLRIEGQEDFEIPPAGWDALSKALCDTSTINNTYLSNHIIQELYYWEHGDEDYFNIDIDERVVQYLQLNKEDPQYAARCKILMSHTHLNMTPLLQWELKCLPLAVGWFEKAKPCATLSIDDIDSDSENSDSESEGQALEESEKAFQSRVLTALYEFVRGMTEKVLERRDELALVTAYDDKIAMAEDESKWLREEKKRLREDVEQRDREIAKLKEEIKRLRES
eukprot:scaffold3316_cov94-Skeletonema_marinoi.AAC.18